MTPELKAATDATQGDQATAAALEAKHASGQDLTPEEWAQLNGAVTRTNAAFAPIFSAAAAAPTPAAPAPTGPATYLQNGLTTYADGTPVAGGYNALADYYRQTGTTPGMVDATVIRMAQHNPALIGALPADQQANLRRTLSSQGITLPAASPTPVPAVSPRTPVGTGPTLGAAVPLATNTPAGAASGASGASGASASGTYTPSDVAIGSAVLPNTDPRLASIQQLLDSTASSLAGVDRTKLAQRMFDTFAESTDPAYQKALRDATRYAAGAGRIGSGMLRTSYGDLANQRAQQLQTEEDQLLQDALNGSIADQFNKTSALSGLESQLYGEAADTNNQLRTERGYQGSLEEQAFERALAQYQLDQQAKQQQFNNGLALTSVGNAGNPADYLAQLARELGVDPSVIASLASQLGQAA